MSDYEEFKALLVAWKIPCQYLDSDCFADRHHEIDIGGYGDEDYGSALTGCRWASATFHFDKDGKFVTLELSCD